MEKIKIRKFRKGDEYDIAKVIRAANRISLKAYYSPSVIKKLCADAGAKKIRKKATDRKYHVAMVGKKIVGAISFKENRIRQFFVHPKYQGNGIGRSLLELVEKQIKQLKHRNIELNSSLFAVEFYKHFGYKKIKKYRHAKMPWMEVVLMKKYLKK